MKFSADNLPDGLTLDSATGNITGTLHKQGEYNVCFTPKIPSARATRNSRLSSAKRLTLTPAMGWNSWNHYAGRITQDIVLQNAKAMVDSGLIDHGWTYVNIDDTWQGKRSGKTLTAFRATKNFPTCKGMCDADSRDGFEIRHLFDALGNVVCQLIPAAVRKIPKAIGQSRPAQKQREQKNPAVGDRAISLRQRLTPSQWARVGRGLFEIRLEPD